MRSASHRSRRRRPSATATPGQRSRMRGFGRRRQPQPRTPGPWPPERFMGADASGLLLVHAHPDDEAFGTGGLIARSVAEGRRVDLVTCTGGEEGEIHDPTLDEAEA